MAGDTLISTVPGWSESEGRFRALVEASSDVIYRMNSNWTHMEYLAGCDFIPDTDELNNTWLSKYIPFEEQARVTAAIEEAIRNKSVFELTHQVIRVNGSLGWIFSRAIPIIGADGEIVEWFGMAKDITESKQAVYTVEHTSNLLAEVQKIAHIGIFEYVIASGATVWSEGEYRIYGLDPIGPSPTFEELLARCIHPDDVHLLRESMRGMMEEHIVYELEHRVVWPDGSVRWVYNRAHPFFNDKGSLVRYVGVTQDITEIKLREQALQQANYRLGLAQSAAHAGIWDWDIPGHKLYWSAEFLELFCLSPDAKASFETWRAVVHPDDLADAERRIHTAIEEHRPLSNQYRIILPDGCERWIDAYGETAYDADSQPVRMTGICLDVTARKLAELELYAYKQDLERIVDERSAKLRLAMEAAETANRAKTVFLANMSHELRTPLNAILGFAQLLERDNRIPEEQRQNIATISRAGSHLLSLINDVLEISRIEAGRTSIKIETFDLTNTLSVIQEMMRLRAEKKGLAFSIEAMDSLPHYVQGDEHRLRQVLTNLLGNAIKYTDQGQVTLRLIPVKNNMRFEVIDTGCGIAADDQKGIFRAFYQTERGIAQGEGTGLGLAISQEFVRLMGGQVNVISELGRGSTFTFSIPLPRCDAVASAPAIRRVLSLAPNQAVKRVLVAEDNPDNRQLLISLLQNVGFDVHTVKNGREAVEAFQSWQPDFIWMDMRMPVMDGFVATKAIRALPGGIEVKIVALTASAFQEDREAILAAGCDDVLAKPVDQDRLFQVLGELLHLEYRYADIESISENKVELYLHTLKEDLRAELQKAAEILDVEGCYKTIERIRKAHPEIANAVEPLIKEFRFDLILTALRNQNTK